MNGGKRPLGYTIIEVMIVLGVSGMMFVIAASFVNGKQARSAFTAGVNEMASTLQDNIEKVLDGQYSDVPLTCTAGSPTTADFGTYGSDSQGQQSSCVFLGKVLHFDKNSVDTNYETFSIIGSRLNSSGQPITALDQSQPGVAVPLTTQQQVPQALSVTSITYKPVAAGVSVTSTAVGFLQSLPANDASHAGLLKTGAQTIDLYAVKGLTSQDTSSAATAITATNLVSVNSVSLCLTDNTRYARITIGNDGSSAASPLSVDVKMLGSSSGGALC